MLHQPELLLLDEPTAGVDPKARREFWEELHALAARGISILVSTHYMDEAERCHKLAYIAYGSLMAQGTAAEIIAAQGLTTWAVLGGDLSAVAARLQGEPGVEQIAAFGAALHVTGRDAAALEAALRRATADTASRIERAESGLEDVFIHLMSRASDNFGSQAMKAFSVSRWWGIVLKEFLQLRRDRITFGMIVGIPIVQLLLFGYAINTEPKHLPTAVVIADHSEFTRSFLAAMQSSGYFRLRCRAAHRGRRARRARARRREVRGEHSRPISPADCCAASGPPC